ncbi:MAG: LysR family transcriptional regulator, partial [Lachnospiraceae bacterium]|nr:LysR family transcriptional regulator [Lachnospiraceae bacterium]
MPSRGFIDIHFLSVSCEFIMASHAFKTPTNKNRNQKENVVSIKTVYYNFFDIINSCRGCIMNFDQLRYFKIAAEEENLGRASQKLHITQQGLSANIIKLENELGVYLFDRIGRQIFLSEQGKIFLRYTDMILQDLQSAEDALQSNLEEKQRTIAVSTTGANLASLLISGYLSCHNGTNIILNIIADKYIPFALAQHNVNFVVTSVPYNSPETDSIVLYEQPFVVLASKNHPLSERTEISLEELKNEK